MNKKTKKTAAKIILLPLGGLVIVVFFELFFQSPPGRAEYDTDKMQNEQEHKNIIDKFKIIHDDLKVIKKILMQGG